jgi:catechol 1,2-dioxygenase
MTTSVASPRATTAGAGGSKEEDTMTESLIETDAVQELLTKSSGLDHGTGNDRIKQITHRLLTDLFRAIDDFDIQPDEFWATASYLTKLGQANEFGLLIAGLGIETYLDIRLDAAERMAGITGGTPRTIEGPLYVAGAPLSEGAARLDDDDEEGEVLFMQGQVRSADGNPLADAIVDVWHANTLGGYSFFDPSQKPYNLRRRIQTDADGRYRFRSILPSGYGCPTEGPTQQFLNKLGRHGQRPAHIHFFVTAPGHRKLTTQINIDGDEYLHDDFAFATRDGLIPEVHRDTDPAKIRERGLNGPYAEITFDFVLHPEALGLLSTEVHRVHAEAT